MAEDAKVTVTLTLRKPVAEKLRAMCHRRGETASLVVDRWILLANEAGEIGAPQKPAPGSAEEFSEMVREALAGRRGGGR